MEKLSKYQQKQVELLARHHPYTMYDVEYVYVKCGKSFDKTEKALELGLILNQDVVRAVAILQRIAKSCPS